MVSVLLLTLLVCGALLRAASASAESAGLRADDGEARARALRLSGLGVELGGGLLAIGGTGLLLEALGTVGGLLAVLTAPLILTVCDLLPRTRRARPDPGRILPAIGSLLEKLRVSQRTGPTPRTGLAALTRAPSGDQADAERGMIRGVFDFADATVGDVMVPLIDVVALPETSSIEQATQLVKQCGLSRIPVYRHQLPDIVGVLHAFDLLDPAGARQVSESMKRPAFVPEMIHAGDALRRMQAEGLHLAIVIDEFGGAVGIVTIEDILEEVIGEIADEHDPATELPHEIEPGRWRVRGRSELWLLDERLGWRLARDGVETIGGLMLATLGRVPAVGDEIDIGELRLRATRTTDRAVEEVLVIDRRNET